MNRPQAAGGKRDQICPTCKKTGHGKEDCWLTYPEKIPAKFKRDNKKIQGVDAEIDIGLCAVEIIIPKLKKQTIVLQNKYAQLENNGQ